MSGSDRSDLGPDAKYLTGLACGLLAYLCMPILVKGTIAAEKIKEQLKWELDQLAFKYQEVSVEDAAEMLKESWQFGPELKEHVLRGNIRIAG